MAGWRRAVELAMSEEEIATLTTLSRSRTELASRVSRAQMLLAYREILRSARWAEDLGFIIRWCSAVSSAHWPMAALDDRPRPRKEPTITPEAKA